MNNLANKNTNDFVVLDDQSTLISQRALAKVLGVNENTFKSYIMRTHKNANTINGLDENIAFIATTYFAYKSSVKTEQAEKFLMSLGSAGIRAFNYQQAGYTFIAKRVLPEDYGSALRALADAWDSEQAAIKDRKRLEAQLDESSEWMSIKKVAAHNKIAWKELKWQPLKKVGISQGKVPYKVFDANFPQGVNVYHIDTWCEVYPELDLPK